jgi:hypothetical protein
MEHFIDPKYYRTIADISFCVSMLSFLFTIFVVSPFNPMWKNKDLG